MIEDIKPPSTTKECPLINLFKSLAKNITALAISSVLPSLLSGTWLDNSFISFFDNIDLVISVSIKPGATLFTKIIYLASSTDNVLDSGILDDDIINHERLDDAVDNEHEEDISDGNDINLINDDNDMALDAEIGHEDEK